MKILNMFKGKSEKNSAATAKERLQIIISHERGRKNNDDFMQLQHKLLNVISEYFKVDPKKIEDQVKVDVEREAGHSVLELNITLPDPVALADAQ